MLEAYDNALKGLGGWMSLAGRAQSRPDRLERWFNGPGTLKAVTAADLQAAAQTYLAPEDAVEFLVLPRPQNITRPPANLDELPQRAPAVIIDRQG